MKKVFVNINDCRPGMQVAENIFNEYGAVVISENTVLDDYTIKKMKELGLTKIRIADQTGNIITVSSTELFRAQYNENIAVTKSILHDISTGKSISIDKVNQVTNSLITRINENRDIVSFVNQVREADEYTYIHSVNVALLSMLIGKWLKYDYYMIKSLACAGLLHDVGKARISPDILNKPGPLSNEEFEEVKMHAIYGFKEAEAVPWLSDDILKGILMHHEREDGTGYPFGLKGGQIHDFAKIIAVADIYDAMTSKRSYRNIKCPFEVLELLEKECFGTLDHKVVDTFLKNIAAYYIGNLVKLSTGDIGEIVHINPFSVTKPILKVNDTFVDLSREKGIKILELL